jgi:hypothetical protein
MYEARKAFEEGNLPKAKQLYQEGFAKWRIVLDEFPFIMTEDNTTGDDLLEFVKKYRQVLDQLDERLGDDFPLWDVVEKFDKELDFTEELAERRERQGGTAEGATPPSQEAPADAADAAKNADEQ